MMARSRVDLYNQILRCIKVGVVLGGVDDPAAYKFDLPSVYDESLRTLLDKYQWGFATKTKPLAEINIPLEPGELPHRLPKEITNTATYRHTYSFPADCVSLLDVGYLCARPGCIVPYEPCKRQTYNFYPEPMYEVESIEIGDATIPCIVTEHKHAVAKYVCDSVPETYWPASFVQAFKWFCASNITRGLNSEDNDADYRMQQALAHLSYAKAEDARERNGRHTRAEFNRSRGLPFIRGRAITF